MTGDTLSTALLLAGLLMARLLPLVFLLPFLGGKELPLLLRLALALALTVLFYPLATEDIATPPWQLLELVALALKELAVGLAIGFLTALMWKAMEMAGHLVESVSGLGSSSRRTASWNSKASPLVLLWWLSFTVLFFTLGGYKIFIVGLAESFRVIPLTGFAQFTPDLGGMMEGVIGLTARLFVVALALASPIIAVMFIADLVLGAISRITGQANTFFLAMPLKPLLAITMVLLSTAMIMYGISRHMEPALEEVWRLLGVR